jgi:cyanophycinase
VAIDEDTALTVGADGRALVRGAGLVHVVRPDGDGVRVRSFRPGERVAL